MGLRNGWPVIALAALASLSLAGCGGPSADKVKEIQTAVAEISAARDKAEAVYDSLYDDALFARITEAGKRAEEYADPDLAGLTDEAVEEELLPRLEKLKETYAGLQEMLDQTAAAEAARQAEEADRHALSLHIRNQSGETLAGLTWTAGSREVLALAGELAPGETLAGITLPLRRSDLTQTVELRARAGEEERSFALEGAASLEPGKLYYMTLLAEGKATVAEAQKAAEEEAGAEGSAEAEEGAGAEGPAEADPASGEETPASEPGEE